MAWRNEKMRILKSDLNRLFQLCGVDEETSKTARSTGFRRLMESASRNQAFMDELDILDRQARRAVRALEERKLEEWNHFQNEERIRELEEQAAEFRERSQEPAGNRGETGDREKSVLLEMIRGLIAVRDHLLIQRDWLKNQETGKRDAEKFIEGQLAETAKILEKAGVEILEDEGDFDSGRHTVVDTRMTDDIFLENQIAEVFRPGYAYSGELLRGQEVILYVYGQTAGGGHGAEI